MSFTLGLTAPALTQEIKRLAGHQGEVQTVRYTEDGKYLVSASSDGTVRLWHRATGSMAGTIDSHDAAVLGLSLPRNGLTAASSDLAGRVLWHDLPLRDPLTTFAATNGPQVTLALSPAGNQIVSGDAANLLRIWDANTGQTVRDLGGITVPVQGSAWLGDLVYATLADGTLRAWNAANGSAAGVVATSKSGQLLLTGAGQSIYLAGADGLVRRVTWPPQPPLKLLAHKATITATALSRDGKLLLSGSNDQVVQLSDPGSATLIRTLAGHTNNVAAVALSDDGQLAASGNQAGIIRFWNTADGADRLVLAGHKGAVKALRFLPSGQVASGGEDGTLRLWNLPVPGVALAGHTQTVLSVATAPSGQVAITGAADKTAQIWKLPDTKPVRGLTGHADAVTAVALKPDEKQAATADATGTIRLWSLAEESPAVELWGHAGAVRSLAYHPQQPLVASAGSDGTLRLWRIDAPPQSTVATLAAAGQALVVRDDGKEALVATADGKIQELNLSDGSVVRTYADKQADVTALAAGKSGTWVVSGAADGKLRFWQGAEPKLLGSLTAHAGGVLALAWSEKAGWLASAGADGKIRLWKLTELLQNFSAEATAADELSSHEGPVTSLAFSASGQRLLSGGADKQAVLWQMSDRSVVRKYGGAVDRLSAVAFSPDELLIVAASADKNVRVWKRDDAALDATWTLSAAVRQVVVSGDGRRLAAVTEDHQVRLFDLPAKIELERLAGSTALITGLAISADGQTVYSASRDKTVRRLTAKAVWTARAHDGQKVHDLAFLPDGNGLLSVGEDKLTRRFDLTGKPVATLSGAEGPLRHVSLRSDGTQVLAGGNEAANDPNVYWWTLADNKLVKKLTTPAGVTGLSYSADNSRLLIGGADNRLRVYSADGNFLLEEIALPAAAGELATWATGPRVIVGTASKTPQVVSVSIVSLLSGHQGPIHSLAVVPAREKGKPSSVQLLSGGEDATLRLWDLAPGAVVRTYRGAGGPVTAVASRADGQQLAAASADKSVRLYAVDQDQPAHKFDLPAVPRCLAWDEGGGYLAVGGDDQKVVLLDAANRCLLETLPGHAGVVQAVQFRPASAEPQIVSAGADAVQLLHRPAVRKSWLVSAPTEPISLHGLPGETAVLAAGRQKVLQWKQADGTPLAAAWELPVAATALTVSADGQLLAAAGDDKKLRLWQRDKRQLLAEVELPGLATALSFTLADEQLLVAGDDKILRNFQRVPAASEAKPQQAAPRTLLRLTQELHGAADVVRAIAVSADGRLAWAAGNDRIVRRWPVAAARPRQEFAVHPGPVYRVALHPDGTWLATGCADGRLRQFHTADGTLAAERAAHANAILGLVVHPKGTHLATASLDRTWKLWDPALEPLRQNQDDATGPLACLQQSSDGTLLATAGSARSWQVWSAATGKQQRIGYGHYGPIAAVAFQANSARLATLDFSGHLCLWDSSNGNLIMHRQLPALRAYDMAIAPDGKEISVATNEPDVLLVPVAQ